MTTTTKAQSKNATKLQQLAEIEGFNDPLDMLEAYACDSVSPAICMNFDCDYTTEMEPDQTCGWCDECATNSMKSAFILAGVI